MPSATVNHLPEPWATELNAGVNGEESEEEERQTGLAEAPGPRPTNTEGK